MASRTPSDDGAEQGAAEQGAAAQDPLRPDDHRDARPAAREDVAQPRLGPLGYLRFFWRQLTSMRTALVLLLLMALAAIPGSLVPQNTSDPNGVRQYEIDDPELYKVLDGIQLFDTFGSVWFSAIYLLLFISLIGCIIPRTLHHARALRARPPKTPARLSRLVGYQRATSAADADTAIEEAARLLRRGGYRVERYPVRGGTSVSAERGYLRETGNLVFHAALVGVLLAVGLGQGFGYTGQRVLVQDSTFTNTRAGYDSFNPGRFVDGEGLAPYSLRLDDFTSEYTINPVNGKVQAEDFEVFASVREQGGDWREERIKVNHPLEVGGTQVFLLGNGYAPEITVRDPDGNIVDEGPVVFRPQDANLSGLGVLKVPDGLAEQVGLIGFFYPSPFGEEGGPYTSVYPEAGESSLLTLQVFTGDLGLDDGVARNVYLLDTSEMTAVAGQDSGTAALELKQGERVELPDGLGSVEFTGLKRFVALDIHHDSSQTWVLVFALLAVAGLLTSLFVPRRRLWVTAVPVDAADAGAGSRIEFAGLARGDDPTLERAVEDLAWRHREQLGDPAPEARAEARD
ncbi:cytochrome c biogenesis protein ResB [Homoserinibacter sp. YIM 151385]|uniref:cytochrome c biogenesis protein ResB n=1 Tax=Homoserinibacter sp. YIM 151385 TaxID=2985506 RepID=UPI0022F038B0|nr:cytochrome c biogenesis protein ResB [Homoserinibacter sp. YIM 151385]WBU37011.1 cytochrome c biogenesis protein ResB [Homoserinibacter sp. YIM 151385]